MDTDKLRYFSMIAETGSLTKASQILGISHSGLSKAVSALENELNFKLFRPQGRGLEITPEGKWFYQKAQEILRIADEIKDNQKKKPAFIRVGLSAVIVNTCAGLIAAEFDGPLALHEIDVGEVETKVISGDLDFGIAFIPSPQPELEYLEIGEVQFSSHAREDIIKNLDKLPYVIPTSDFAYNPLGYRNRDGWPQEVPRHPKFAVSDFAIALDLCRAGQTALYMPDFIADLENAHLQGPKIVVVKEHKAAQTKRKLFLVKRQTSEESREMKKIVKVVRRACCL